MESQCSDLRVGLTLVQLVEPGWRLGPAPPDHGPRGVGGEREPLQVPQQCGGSLFHDRAFALDETSYHTWPLGSGFPTLLMNCGLFAAPHRALRARRDIRQRAGTRPSQRLDIQDSCFSLSI